MADLKFSNFATSTIADVGGIGSGDTTVNLSSGDGNAKFPSLTGSQYFYVIMVDSSANREVAKVTARSSDTLTIVRAQDGTSARAFAQGDKIELRLNKGALEDIQSILDTAVQNSGDESITGTKNFTGTLQVSGNEVVGSCVMVNDANGRPEISSTYLDVDSSITTSEWWAVYPTAGSPSEGAVSNKVVWSALDSVPSGADYIRVSIKAIGTKTATSSSSHTLSIAARKNGSTETSELNIYSHGLYILNGVYGQVWREGVERTIPVSSGMFDLRWVSSFSSNNIEFKLIGWGFNPS